MATSRSLPIVSQSIVVPSNKSPVFNLKLSVSDLPMLSCHYIQKGGLFTRPNLPMGELISKLRNGLSQALSSFPPLAGRLTTDAHGYVYIICNDAGVKFIHANGSHLRVEDLVGNGDVPEAFKGFFACDGTVSYAGHFEPLLAVQVTELKNGVFIGCSMNHSVADGTSFWNFFNAFAEVTRSEPISNAPDFRRDSILISLAVLRLPAGGPSVTFVVEAPLRERIFRFNRDSIQRLKSKASNNTRAPISSFQSLCALLWRGITRARQLHPTKRTTFRMAVNCRSRLNPNLHPLYFGNAIQSIPTYASAGEVLDKSLQWCASQLNENVVAYGDDKVRKYVADWEKNPQCFPLGNPDGAMITIGSSPRFPMYEIDFGWGKPVVVRSGRANKFDGKISAFPGREGNGSVDLEVVLNAVTMSRLISDQEFMSYVV